MVTSQPQGPVRVVVAGMGAVSPYGQSVEALWDGVVAGRVAIRPIRRMATEGYRSHIGGEAPHPLMLKHDYEHPPGWHEPQTDFALSAVEEAISAAGPGLDRIPRTRWGMVMGNSAGAFFSLRAWYTAHVLNGESGVGPLLLGPAQLFAETVAGVYGFGGPVISVTNSCAAGATAIGLALDLIRSGQADVMVAGGAEALTEFVYAAFHCIEALSPEPATPYSADRSGLSLGEGCGVLLLVREDIAHETGVPILGELLGYGLSSDGYDPTAPEPSGGGMARAMKAALCAAGLTPDDVDYINGHGTGTPRNDPAETAGIRLALGARADHVPVSSTKSMIGHLLGGAGGVESVVTVRAIQEQIAPPTAGYRHPDPDCDLDYVPNVARPMTIDVALSNNFAFGGANATLALGRYHPDRVLPVPQRERVVVTGLSALIPAGQSVEALWQIAIGRSDGTSQQPLIGRLELDPAPILTPRDRRRMDDTGVYAVVASVRALEDAGIKIAEGNRERIGVMFGTGVGSLDTAEAFWRPVYEEGPRAANPALAPNLVHNAAPGQVSIRTGAVGPTATITGGHAAGAMAICCGYNLLADGRADAMICVVSNALSASIEKAYRDLGVVVPGGELTPSANGVAVILETLSSARARGARIYGEIAGYGMACDATGVGRSDPHGSGLQRAMRQALAMAGLACEDIGVIWANAFGHRATDIAERRAIRRVFGSQVEVFAPKRVLGEPIGAGGSLNLALAVESWQQNGDGSPRPVLINSCSLGGTHVAIVAERCKS
jgi:3-oxoacyl-[acyl-carrier-protein] synthase II